MKTLLKPIATVIYRAWLRSRLDNYTRSLHIIAAQRENDFYAERTSWRHAAAAAPPTGPGRA
jgi:hypothetical protein